MCAAGNGYIKVVDMLFKRGSGILNLNMQTTKVSCFVIRSELYNEY